MNWPNILTLSRVAFAFIVVYLLLLNSLIGDILAAAAFALASLTDFYDGYLAKKKGLISDFGKIMDPIADKVLMLSIFSCLAYMGLIDGWMVLLIAIREIGITVDRLWCMKKGQVLAAERAGKIKTAFQILTVSFILIYLILEQMAFSYDWFYQIQGYYLSGIDFLMMITVLLTLVSGVSYFRNKFKSCNSNSVIANPRKG